jgi:membrane protein required for colicin V production
MLDIAVGIFILLFAYLGAREGVAKSLASIIVVFVALFLAGSALIFLGRTAPEFNNPDYLGAVIVFFLSFTIAFVLLDLILSIILKKIISIVVLGPVDKVVGAVVGSLKGLLIVGILLQLALGLPIPTVSRQAIKEALLSKLAIASYQWAYPEAKRLAPAVNSFMKENILDRIGQKENLKEETKDLSPDKLVKDAVKYEKVKTEQEQKIHQLLKEQKLLPGAPLRRIEDVK